MSLNSEMGLSYYFLAEKKAGLDILQYLEYPENMQKVCIHGQCNWIGCKEEF